MCLRRCKKCPDLYGLFGKKSGLLMMINEGGGSSSAVFPSRELKNKQKVLSKVGRTACSDGTPRSLFAVVPPPVPRACSLLWVRSQYPKTFKASYDSGISSLIN